jgi:diadenosine tetraphosphate (Ap4A) HIT family hydrolase
LLESKNILEESTDNEDYSKYRYVYPPNARQQSQLDIMVTQEGKGIDPFDPEIIDQDILFSTNNWYVSRNRFPYEGIEHQFLVIAYNPVYRIEDMSAEMWSELNYIWNKLSADFNIPGGALCFRFGDPALSGASLRRLHAHLIVPKENVKAKFSIGGRKTLKKGLILKFKKCDEN